MLIFPAIDLYEGKAVRLLNGDYGKMTVYSENPPAVAESFKMAGAEWIHLVDLEGAKSGETPNFDTVKNIVERTGLKAEVGGGIRSEDTIKKYYDAGVSRVILGTAAVKEPEFLKRMAARYGERIAVGADIREGQIAVNGWTELSSIGWQDFLKSLTGIGIKTLICTDISRDGAMRGTNAKLYSEMNDKYGFDVIASGGVSRMEDVAALKKLGLYGAIIGRALYTGHIILRDAVRAAL